ncbi:outer membrane beta-barrel protein [Ruegeria sp. HKCCD6228]|uniref:Outer membrane beta-barrel protein n=1 Tax=Ruegeria atlantica TaxID=81569 RepID=A0AA90YWS9_9RHOB|nr:outer membrane beta-barrel protein [Ruegeria sp. HKCCD6428]NOC93152.1 outer membrane beta-barrel protein [Ruegeria sp. HKCCD6604]NOD30942.1 outer membrane beta-barrel protein [Ruegeria atlantica]NOD97333.1 outer membrane beta-barrel protein [Ruegeria sp. HKCCD6228]NOE18663.1 outer membrane beta-barrel protein [Ruegeria atlantica]
MEVRVPILNSFRTLSLVKTLPLASVVTFFASATIAGDLKGTTTDPVVISPKKFSSDVSAFYLGIAGGYASGWDDRFGLRTPAGLFDIGDLNVSGAYGGFRGGWRGVLPSRWGRDFVYGFEVSYDFGSLDDSVRTQISGADVQGGTEVSDVLSLRYRSGLTSRNGRVLYFFSVGYLWGDVETTNNIATGTSTQNFAVSDRRGGYTASIGAEHKLTDNWSVTGEYEYVQFKSEDVQFGSGFSTKSTPKYGGLRFGLNYTF